MPLSPRERQDLAHQARLVLEALRIIQEGDAMQAFNSAVTSIRLLSELIRELGRALDRMGSDEPDTTQQLLQARAALMRLPGRNLLQSRQQDPAALRGAITALEEAQEHLTSVQGLAGPQEKSEQRAVVPGASEAAPQDESDLKGEGPQPERHEITESDGDYFVNGKKVEGLTGKGLKIFQSAWDSDGPVDWSEKARPKDGYSRSESLEVAMSRARKSFIEAGLPERLARKMIYCDDYHVRVIRDSSRV